MGAPVLLKNATDSYVSEKYPAKNYSTVNRLYLADNSAADTRYAYMYFGVPSGMANTTIISAKLRLYSGQGFGGAVTVSVARLSQKFTGTRVNWNTKPAVTGASINVTKTNAPINTMWEFDVTAMMQQIANGSPWYGVRISATNSTAKWLHSAQAAAAYRPVLEITWSDAPDTPEVLIPDNGEVISVEKPVLQWNFTDPSGDTTMQAYQLKVFTTEADALVAPAGANAVFDQTVFSDTPQADLSELVATGGTVDGMVNGSADAGIVGYAGFSNCTVTHETTVTRTGAGALKVTATGAGFALALGGYTAGNRMTIAEGESVSVTSWARSSVASMGAALKLYFYDTNMALLSFVDGTAETVTSAGWTDLTVSGSAPFGAAYAVIGYYTGYNNAGDAVYFDDTVALKPSGAGWPTVVDGATRWWRVRVQDGAGLWSGWSDPASWRRRIKGVAAITNPAAAPNDFVTDNTPPFAWTFTGRTQRAFEVLISTPERPANYLWRSGIVTSTDNDVTPPIGVITENGKVYRIVLRIYDTEPRRSIPGDDIFVEVFRDFTYNLDNTVDPVTNFNGAISAYRPEIVLTFDRATAPDFFVIYRDGKVVKEVEPSDIFVTDTSYRFVDGQAPPRVDHTWTVAAKVNGKVSNGNPTVTGKIRPVTTVLSEPDNDRMIFLLNPNVSAERAEESEIHYILGDAPPVLITQSHRGYEGKITGVLASDSIPNETAAGQLANLEYFKDNPGMLLKLIWIDKVLQVVVRNVTDTPVSYADGTIDYLVSFEFFQVDF